MGGQEGKQARACSIMAEQRSVCRVHTTDNRSHQDSTDSTESETTGGTPATLAADRSREGSLRSLPVAAACSFSLLLPQCIARTVRQRGLLRRWGAERGPSPRGLELVMAAVVGLASCIMASLMRGRL